MCACVAQHFVTNRPLTIPMDFDAIRLRIIHNCFHNESLQGHHKFVLDRFRWKRTLGGAGWTALQLTIVGIIAQWTSGLINYGSLTRKVTLARGKPLTLGSTPRQRESLPYKSGSVKGVRGKWCVWGGPMQNKTEPEMVTTWGLSAWCHNFWGKTWDLIMQQLSGQQFHRTQKDTSIPSYPTTPFSPKINLRLGTRKPIKSIRGPCC